MKRKKILLIEVLICFLLIITLVAAQDVCCEKTKVKEDGSGGAWCESVPESECNLELGHASTSCDETGYCGLGTCIDMDEGTCTSTRRAICDDTETGHFVPENKDDIPMCQNGCCLIGEDVAFVTHTECKQIATDFGININFREDIKEQGNCFALASPKERGACVIEKDYVKDCTITTGEECQEKESSILDSNVKFHAGLLCTAGDISDCAKSGDTKCENDKVYFLDTCGNLANVYEETRYGDNDDYWTYIQESQCITSGASETCGNCMPLFGSICSKYKPGEGGMPTSAPEYGSSGKYICRDLGCYEGDTQIAEHGESWCAESEGTYWHLPEDVSGIRDDVINDDGSITIGLENETAYNLPGSRYYKSLCWDGEVLTYPCMELRGEICKEIDMEGFNVATCTINKWRFCDAINSSTECEDSYNDCKWISGYRFDRVIVEVDKRDENQGSCVPLYAPGFEFWKPESDAHAICGAGVIQDSAVYETYWMTIRNNFQDVPTKDAAERCLENCYLIPDYGSVLSLEQVKSFYEGGALPQGVGEYHLSARRGHYCARVNDPDIKKLGLVVGDTVYCADNEDKRRVPLFYQHSQWLNFVRKRTRSMGDCGFTDNSMGEPGQPGSELITVIFEKLNQKGEVTANSTAETIYIGDERTTEYRE